MAHYSLMMVLHLNPAKVIKVLKQSSNIQVLSMTAVKYQGDFRVFQLPSAKHWGKKLAKTEQKPLHITSAIALTNLCILSKALIWFLAVESTCST